MEWWENDPVVPAAPYSSTPAPYADGRTHLASDVQGAQERLAAESDFWKNDPVVSATSTPPDVTKPLDLPPDTFAAPAPDTGPPITSVNGPTQEPDEMTRMFPNEKVRHAVAAGANLISDYTPKSLGDVGRMFAPPTYQRFQEDIARSKPEYDAVEATPPWSQARFEHYGNAAAQVLMAAGIGKGAIKPEMAAGIPRTELDAKIAAAQSEYANRATPASEAAAPPEAAATAPPASPLPEARLSQKEIRPSTEPIPAADASASGKPSREELIQRKVKEFQDDYLTTAKTFDEHAQAAADPETKAELQKIADQHRAEAQRAATPQFIKTFIEPKIKAKDYAEPPPSQAKAGVEPVPEVTSTKNAVTAGEREARGLPEAEQAARRDFGTVWDEATAEAAQDPTVSTRLVDSLVENPRALKDVENAHLLRRQIEVQSEHDAAIQNQNEKPGDPDAQARLDAARDEVQKVYDVGKAAGTETGRGLSARRMLAANDFSLAKMEAETRAVVNQGKPLSGEQAANISALHERIATAETKLAGYEAQEQFRRELKAAKASRQPQPEFLRQSYDAAKTRIASRRGRLYTGVDPTALVDEAIVGAYHISRGVAKFADWSVEMVREFGETIKPHLQAIFAKARALHSESSKATNLSLDEKISRALEGDKKRIRTGTAEYERRTEAGDTSPLRPNREPRMDREKTALLFEREKARDAYHEMLYKAQLKNRTALQKIGGAAAEVVGVSRAIKSSFDVSAVFRQGGLDFMGHPISGLKNTGPMLKAMASEKGMFAVMEEIKSRPNAPLYKQSRLDITESGSARLGRREEHYQSRVADKIPGVAMSERAYTTYLDKTRADRFDAMAHTLTKKGKPLTPYEARIISNYINVITGRGAPGRMAPAMTALAKVFWSPRLVMSRFQYLLGQPLFSNLGKGSFRARRLIAKEYARTLAGIGITAAAATYAGAHVELDPRSKDFGKARFGNTRVDFLAGVQQPLVLLSSLLTGERKTSKGKIEPITGRLGYGKGDAYDTIADFTRTKLAPAYGSAINARTGTDPVGNPTTALNEAIKFFGPLSPGDVADALKTEGVPEKMILPLLALGGMSTSNYGSETQKDKDAKRANLEKRDSAVYHGDFLEAIQRTLK